MVFRRRRTMRLKRKRYYTGVRRRRTAFRRKRVFRPKKSLYSNEYHCEKVV